jgi:hypothetical protein
MNALKRLSATVAALFLGLDKTACRALAMAVLAVQTAGALAAPLTHLMLHADGSQFVYAICVDRPWLLKWRNLAARATIYVTTVVPTQWATRTFHLAPMAVADLNGLLFYGAPAVLFAIACALVWRRHPRWLIFPVLQYVFSSSLGYGFPSEITLAPGFLWIALFPVEQNRILHPATLVSLLALIFCHELAAPSAILVMAMGMVRLGEAGAPAKGRMIIFALASIAALALFVVVRQTGGGVGSNDNADRVFAPEDVLINPTLWLGLGAAAGAFALALYRPGWFSHRATWLALAAIGVALPLILYLCDPAINFQRGRYGSRTIVGIDMTVLAILFAIVRLRARPDEAAPSRWSLGIAPAAAAALAISVGAATAFLIDWSLALRGVERVVIDTPQASAPLFVPYRAALTMMRPEEARANGRMEANWALSFRSAVLANGAAPAHIVVTEYRRHVNSCRVAAMISPDRSNIPISVLAEMRQVMCRRPLRGEPPPRSPVENPNRPAP